MTCAFTPQGRSARPSGELMNFKASLPKRAGELRATRMRNLGDLDDHLVADRESASDRQVLQPVEPHVDEQVVARERPAVRLGNPAPPADASTRS